MQKVLVIDADYENMKKYVKRVFEEFSIDLKGKKVMVKPNILGPFEKEKGVTTHPSLVRAVVEYLESEGAKIVVGDNPGPMGYGMNEQSARVSGIFNAAGKYYKNIGKDSVTIDTVSKYFSSTVVSKDIIDCDILISLPKFKTHSNTKITGGIKNMYGILVGNEKAKIHRIASKPKQFAEALIDVYQIRKPDLTIMDAVIGMEGDGPNSKDLRNIGKLMASDNAVCLDAVMAEMMGVKPREIDLLRIANERGLGDIGINRINVIGKIEKIPNFKMPLDFVVKRRVFPLYEHLAQFLISRTRLVVNNRKCVKCRACMESCPVKAISVNKDGNIEIDTKKCIKCYCCKEMCRYHAIDTKGLIERMKRMRSKKQSSNCASGR